MCICVICVFYRAFIFACVCVFAYVFLAPIFACVCVFAYVFLGAHLCLCLCFAYVFLGAHLCVYLWHIFVCVRVFYRAPIFACIGMTERDLSWQKDFTLWPFGPCHKVVKRSEVMEPRQWGEVTGRIAEGWNFLYDG